MLILLATAALSATIEVHDGEDLWGPMSALQPGDELIVHEGTWTSQQSGGSWFREVALDGTQAAPIVVRAADGVTPRITGDPGGSQNTLNLSGTWFTFQGFELEGGSHGLRLGTSDHGTLADLHIHHTGDVGLSMNRPGNTFTHMVVRGTHIHDTDGTGECMYLGCNDDGCQVGDSLIELNYCHDTHGSQGDGIELKSGSYGNTIRDNVIHDTPYPGIVTYGASGRGDNRIERNYVARSGDNGIQVVGEAIVRDNIVIDSTGNGIASKPSQGSSPVDLLIAFNTVVGAGDSCLRGNEWGGASGIVVSSNALFCGGANATKLPNGDGGVTWSSNVGEGNDESGTLTNSTLDAALPTAVIGDHYPKSPSPLIGAGDASHLGDSIGFDCQGRGTPPDVGALWSESPTLGPWVEGPKACQAVEPGDTGDVTDTGDTDEPGDSAQPMDTGPGGNPAGCGCDSGGAGWGWWIVVPLLSVARRRGHGP